MVDAVVTSRESYAARARVTRKLKVSEYAEREGVSIRTVRRWIEKGAIDIVRVGPSRRIRVIA
jgi:excisionase family DNA binding protein